MKITKLFILICIAVGLQEIDAQENLTYQLPPESILRLADFERAPQVVIDSITRTCCSVTAAPINRWPI